MKTFLTTDRPETIEDEKTDSGLKLYFLSLSEIHIAKHSDTSDVPKEIQEDKETKFDEAYDMLRNPDTYPYPIPRPGINAEVLFYLALKDIIDIKPSTFKEDYSEHFDFKVLGTKIDITSSTLDETFIKKFSDDNPPTLLIPEYAPQEENEEYIHTYAYLLLHKNLFDTEVFLKHVLLVNYELLDILKEIKYRGVNNNYGFKPEQFGKISIKTISRQQAFLDHLSSTLGIEVDKD